MFESKLVMRVLLKCTIFCCDIIRLTDQILYSFFLIQNSGCVNNIKYVPRS